MKTLSPEEASARIHAEFARRGWRLSEPFPTSLVREILTDGGLLDAVRFARRVPRVFLTTNDIRAQDVQQALSRALDGYRIVPSAEPGVTNVFHGKVEFVEKKNEINNSGQWVGNVDSPNSQANVERLQQAQITPAEERSLRQHLGDEEVQKAMALDLPSEEKAPIVGKRLAQAAGVALDTATTFAARFLAEWAKSQGT
jgi:hypothetical protein